VVMALHRYLGLATDLSRLDWAAEETKRTLESFGLIRNLQEEKKKEEQTLRWFI